ncbi:MAG: SdrD B-like domain-containing protein, partial [Ilumatobacteraceae bacterium]
MRGLGSNRLLAGRTTKRHPWWSRVRDVTVALGLALGTLTLMPAAPAQAAAPTNELSVNVSSARTEPRAFGGAGVAKGAAIPDFKYVINIDETGTTDQRNPNPGSGCSSTDPGYPTSCDWPSIKEPSGWNTIYDEGTSSDLPLTNIPDGRYLISVLADDYKIDGAHFCVDMAGNVPGCDTPLDGELAITMQPTPLPDGILRAFVFEDNAPTNMGPDTGEANLDGFVGHIVDTLGEIQTDVYGNPLCTRYEGEDPVTYEIPNSALDPADMTPIPIPGSGGECVSDADGMLAIPHLGPNRYAVSVTPPDGQNWIQTTTLEGNHDYDAWVMEGDTGYDTTFALGGEPVPLPIFGFVQPNATNAVTKLDPLATGEIRGSVVGIKTYTPPIGGSFDFWGGNTGTKVAGPIKRPWISLMDLEAGDLAVWVGRGNANGTFDIPGVPDGNYTIAWWDQPQDYNLNFINVTVKNGQLVRMGQLPLNGWWTEYSGYVFNDANRNGVRDPGENGVPNFTLTIRHRENNLYDRGQNTATTDKNGFYYFESGYPIGEWTVMEAYNESFYTTGLTYQADNQEDPTTVLGAGVDISSLPIIGLSGTVDWGVHAYDAKGLNGVDPRNGGIVGTVSYDTTRNELDPRYAATEDWQVGISGVDVELYAPVDCPSGQPGGTADAPCDADGVYQLDTDGSYLQGKLLNTYLTESWERPTGCTARDVDGNPLVHYTNDQTPYDEHVLVPNQETDGECISSFMQGIQFAPYATDQGTTDANFGAAVNGNYGFGDGCFNGDLDASDPANPDCVGGTFEALGAGDYLVRVVPPTDAKGADPIFKATGEEDINIGDGDQLVPQVLPPACAGPLHTVDLADDGTADNYAAVDGSTDPNDTVPDGVTVPGSNPVDNPTFVDIGGSPYEGTATPTCGTKLVELKNGKSVAPIFNVFSDVPPPARMRTVIIDDVNFSNDPRSIMYGEKAGLAFAPVGIYDFANKLQYTTETDYNGIYDVLMPSTNTISCPTPSGICANMYRFVANDPGIPGSLNPNYNPRFATHAAGAEGLVGAQTFADLAPTQVGLTVESPSTGLTQYVTCPVDDQTPQLFTVSRPYVHVAGDAVARSFTINGLGFGNSGDVTLDGTSVSTSNWTDTSIDVTVPPGVDVGPKQLTVTRASNGESSTNGLTIHALGTGYN